MVVVHIEMISNRTPWNKLLLKEEKPHSRTAIEMQSLGKQGLLLFKYFNQ